MPQSKLIQLTPPGHRVQIFARFFTKRISEIAAFVNEDLVGSGGSFYDKPSVIVRVIGFITGIIAAGTGVLGVVVFCKSSF